MKKSTYTRTALASLLTLSSFGCFAADFSNGSMREMNKQENTESVKTSGNKEVTSISNKKLKEKMDRICNAEPKKKAEEKKKENPRLAPAKDVKSKGESIAKPIVEKSKEVAKDVAKVATKKVKEKKEPVKATTSGKLKIAKDTVKSTVNKANPVVSVDGVDIFDTNPGKSDLRITFGGVVDAQGYGKASPSGDDYKRYNVMAGRSTGYYDVSQDKIKGSNPLFPNGIGNIGDYSDNMGMQADAILHMRAENKNEDLGLLYGADVQFHVPVTEGKGASQGVYAARGRSAHIFMNSEYGDVKLGYQFGPEALMRLDATRIATVDGAADSDWFRKVNLEGAAANFPFYVTPRLYTESFSSESEKLSFRMAGKYNKGVMTTLPFRVAYYSPKYMGARFGLSYAPRYESSLFSVAEGSNALNLDLSIDNVTDKFIKASSFSYVPKSKDLATDISSATDSSIAASGSNGDSSNGATTAAKAAAIEAAAKALFDNIKQPDAAAVKVVIGHDGDINGMKSGFTIDSAEEGKISELATTKKKYAADDAFKNALKEKMGNYANTDDTGKTDLKTARAAVNAAIETAAQDLLRESELNQDRINDAKRKGVRDKVKEVYGNAIVLDAIKNGPHGSSAIKHVGHDYEHIISAGVSYEYDLNDYNVTVKSAAVAEFGKAKGPNPAKHIYNEYVEYNDLMGVNLGVSADYKIDEIQSAKFAASFAYLGKSGQPRGIRVLRTTKYESLPDTDSRVAGLNAQFKSDNQDSKDTMYWTAGAGYQRENVYTSLTYFGSKMNDGDYLHDVALGVQYDLSPACSKSKFVPYAALHYFVTNEKQFKDHKITDKTSKKNAPANQGALLLTGVKFSF